MYHSYICVILFSGYILHLLQKPTIHTLLPWNAPICRGHWLLIWIWMKTNIYNNKIREMLRQKFLNSSCHTITWCHNFLLRPCCHTFVVTLVLSHLCCHTFVVTLLMSHFCCHTFVCHTFAVILLPSVTVCLVKQNIIHHLSLICRHIEYSRKSTSTTSIICAFPELTLLSSSPPIWVRLQSCWTK